MTDRSSALGIEHPGSPAELQSELDRARAALARERAVRTAAEARATRLEREVRRYRSRSTRAFEAIEELREQLEALRGRAGEEPDAEEEAFADAQQEATAAPPPEPPMWPSNETPIASRVVSASAPPPGRWLERALRRLARRSPPLAGRLLLELVPGAEMEQERLVRVLAAGRFARGRAFVRGEGQSFEALRHVLAEPRPIASLRLEPGLSFALAAVLVDPRWTGAEQFTVSYQLPSGGKPGPYLEVHAAAPATVSEEPEAGEVETTIVCPPDLPIAVLAGERPAGTTIIGEDRPLELLRLWLERAQRG